MICGAVSAVASCRRLSTDRRTRDPGVEACQAHHCVLVTASPGAPLKPSVHIFRACLHFSGSARSSCGPGAPFLGLAPLAAALPVLAVGGKYVQCAHVSPWDLAA
jgi:hypothetical protein